jgi:molybdopterin-synthase adenylyltransferase
VDLTNLQRQILHPTHAVGQPKAQSAQSTVQALNPDVQFVALNEKATTESLAQWVKQADVVLDCTDNFSTRQAINSACITATKPLVAGAAIRFDGQITVIDPRLPDAPCWACLFPPHATIEEARCASLGVFAPLVGMVGAMQAAEALKLVVGLPSLAGRLLMVDGRSMQWTDIRVARQPQCPVCGPKG